ncbi:MAG: bacillithiol system redox-active protein YtxJ [Cytophagales bacterium]|nr:MAG: bacillithiol system redox-active protein YtxJ [Cytophagales bacterium]
MITWKNIENEQVLEKLLSQPENEETPILIFKHSTRCSISANVLDRLQRQWDTKSHEAVQTYLIKVIEERPLSNALSQRLGITHESPQLFLLKNGKLLFHASHYDISYNEVKKNL